MTKDGKAASATQLLGKLGFKGPYAAVADGELTLHPRVQEALNVAVEYGVIDGAHHKDWCIDQMVRALLGDRYDSFIAHVCTDEDGQVHLDWWDTGIAP